MVEFYLVRHGESKGNRHFQLSGKSFDGAGVLGTDLSEKGKEQIQETAEELKNIKVDQIYSSDLVRAEESALIFAKRYNLDILKDHALREKEEGESSEDATSRLKEFLFKLAEKYKEQKILVVTHGALLRMFLIDIGFAKSEIDLPSGSIENGGYIKVLVDDKFTITKTFKVNKR